MTRETILQYSRSTNVVMLIGTAGIVDLDAQRSLLLEVLADVSEDLPLTGLKELLNRALRENIKTDKINLSLKEEYECYLTDSEEAAYMRSRGISFADSKRFYLWCLQRLNKDVKTSHRNTDIDKQLLTACLHDWVIVGNLSKRVNSSTMTINQLVKCLIDTLYEDSWTPEIGISKIRTFLMQ